MFKNNINKIYLISLWALTLAALVITFSHHGNLIIDCGREAYYPQEILEGKVLYKNLFTIYGPFAYLLNAFLFKIFGIHLNILYIAGSICAFVIVTTLYLISNRFLQPSVSFYASVFAIVTGILNTGTFNFVFPYSFSMTYGLAAVLLSILFLIKYSDTKNNTYLYLSMFFAGCSISCKYEFLPYIAVILFVLIRVKTSFMVAISSLFAFFLIPEINLAYLISKGLNFSDFINTITLLKQIATSKTLEYFYIHSGVFFHKQTPFMLLKNFIITSLPFIIYSLPIIIRQPKFQTLFLCSGILLLFGLKIPSNPECLAFLPVLTLILAIIKFKELRTNTALMILVSSALLISLKVFWGVILVSYGVYFAVILLISCFAMFAPKITDYTGFYILIFAVLFGFSLPNKTFPLKTPKGKIFVSENYEKTTKELFEFIDKNTKKTDKILILPEGMLINFLTERKTDDFYNSLIPLYEESLKSEKILSHFEKNKPNYIIFNNLNTSDYYFSYICKDYAFDFCNFTVKNYFEKTALTGSFNYIIFKLK